MQNTMMLWRESYRPQIHREFRPLPPLELSPLGQTNLNDSPPRVLLIGGGIAALREQELWLRLIQSQFELSGLVQVVTLVTSDGNHTKELQDALPPSRLALWAISPTLSEWSLGLPGLDSSRAALIIPDSAFAVVGPATEEVWEEIQNLLRLEQK